MRLKPTAAVRFASALETCSSACDFDTRAMLDTANTYQLKKHIVPPIKANPVVWGVLTRVLRADKAPAQKWHCCLSPPRWQLLYTLQSSKSDEDEETASNHCAWLDRIIKSKRRVDSSTAKMYLITQIRVGKMFEVFIFTMAHKPIREVN